MLTLPLLLITLFVAPSSHAGDACREPAEDSEIATVPEPALAPGATVLPDSVPASRVPGPDFVVSRYMASSRVYTQWRYFRTSDCSYREGCVAAPGWRRLLRFYTRIINQGNRDFVLGDPADPANSGNVHYDSCHDHYHVTDWASYTLLAPDGSTSVRGRKQAFCLMDSTRVSGTRPERYTCEYQGITAGWADNYEDNIACQYLDITDVPAGAYTLQIVVNPTGRYPETDYSNNAVQVPVRIR